MDYQFDMSRKSICQGDVYLIPIHSIPDGVKPVSPEDGQHIVTHSETGHHHVVMDRPDIQHFSGMDVFTGFLKVENTPADLVHLREHHTHEAQVIPVGSWLVRRQAAYTPAGWEQARD